MLMDITKDRAGLIFFNKRYKRMNKEFNTVITNE